MERKFHPVAELFPLMQGKPFADLVESIRRDGLHNPIWVHPDDGSIVDGRNRERACPEAGVEPRYQTWSGKGSLIAFVVAQNMHRRHLSESQRAMVAARVATMKVGGDRRSDHSPNLGLVSADDAAERLNVSSGSVDSARKVIREAAPEMIQAVDAGVLPVSAAAKLVDRTPEFQARVVAKIKDGTARSAVDAVRLIKREDMKDAPPLPTGKYRVIYADPPYDYGTFCRPMQYGHASFHYPVMPLDEICGLDVAARASDNSVLFLWATSPMLAKSLRVVEAWGFEYKGSFVWNKLKHNFGHYNSVRHEYLLIATRGSCMPDSPKLPNSVQTIKRLPRHSEKPTHFREIIDALYRPPKGRNDRIELFARQRPPKHWDFWANEIPEDRYDATETGDDQKSA